MRKCSITPEDFFGNFNVFYVVCCLKITINGSIGFRNPNLVPTRVNIFEKTMKIFVKQLLELSICNHSGLKSKLRDM